MPYSCSRTFTEILWSSLHARPRAPSSISNNFIRGRMFVWSDVGNVARGCSIRSFRKSFQGSSCKLRLEDGEDGERARGEVGRTSVGRSLISTCHAVVHLIIVSSNDPVHPSTMVYAPPIHSPPSTSQLPPPNHESVRLFHERHGPLSHSRRRALSPFERCRRDRPLLLRVLRVQWRRRRSRRRLPFPLQCLRSAARHWGLGAERLRRLRLRRVRWGKTEGHRVCLCVCASLAPALLR